jgi:lanosterol synthase
MVQTRSAGKPNGHANGHVNGSANGHTVTSARQDERTDKTRWRLKDEQGRHTWHYLETDEQVKEWPQPVVDKHHLGLDTVRITHRMLPFTDSTGTA